jgi:hypothetical protein
MKGNIVLVVLLLFVIACKKEKDISKEFCPEININAPANPSVFPMNNGNYWVYNNYLVDTNNATTFISTDTVKILGDTNINGKTYKVFSNWAFHPFNYQLYRDSIGYLINNEGAVLYSNHNFTDTLYRYSDSLFYYMYGKMDNINTTISVPSGIFTTNNFKCYYYSLEANYPHGSPRIANNYYCDTVGLILKTSFYYSAPSYIESRLVAYQLY